MLEQNTKSKTRNIIGYIGLALLFFVVIELSLINLLVGLVVITGIIIYFPLAKRLKSLSKKTIKITSFVVLATSCIALLIFLLFSATESSGCPISYYRVVATSESSKLNSIKIQEFVVLTKNPGFEPPSSWTPIDVNNKAGFQLPGKLARIESKGFLLKEASFQPSVTCSGSTFVEVHDFPLNTFYGAHYAKELQKYPYIDTETITWNSSFESIRFSYIPPPFQALKPLLNPLIGASSVNQWFLGFVSIIGTIIFMPFIKPVFTEIAQKSIKDKISNPDVPVKQTAKLIISGKGAEKEIETKKKQ